MKNRKYISVDNGFTRLSRDLSFFISLLFFGIEIKILSQKAIKEEHMQDCRLPKISIPLM